MYRRNLIFIVAHGLRSDALADEGRWPLSTPNLKALTTRGLRLVLQSCCTTDPGGAVSLWTGLHARQHGVLREGQPMPTLDDALPAWLKAGGYHTAGVGALAGVGHLFDEVVPVGSVADMEPAGCRYLETAAQRGHVPMLVGQRRQRLRKGPFQPDRLMIEPAHDVDGFITEQAWGLLKRMPSDRPWALFVSYTGPGNELPPPTMYDELVEPGQLHGMFSPVAMAGLDAVGEPAYPRYLLQNLDSAAIARLRADYLGRVALVDHGVGRMLEGLRDRADAHRSWTMVVSDRGVLLGENGLVGHRSALSPALDVPLVLSPPPGGKVDRQDVVEGLFGTADVAPTAAALAGVDAPPGLAGRSLLPLLAGQDLLVAGGSLCEFADRVVLETASHKVVFSVPSGEPRALFDLLHDPDERRNLIGSTAASNVLDALRAQLGEVLLPLRADRRV